MIRTFGIVIAILVMSACSQIKLDTLGKENAIQNELSQLLESIDPVQAVERVEPEEILILRHAPWLTDRFEAQYRDNAKEAIGTVLQGRPVVFTLQRDNNPVVSSSIDAVTVMQHLDTIAVQTDWSYLVDQGVVVFSDSETRQFYIESVPGFGISRVAFNALGNDASGGNIANSLEISNTPYQDLEKALISTVRDYIPVGEDVENANIYSLVPSANTLTVTGSPSLLRRVEGIVSDFNFSATQKVHLIITVYDVAFSDSSQRSLDFNLLRDAAISSSTGFQGRELIQTTPGGLSLGLDFFEDNSLNGSNIVFNLLLQQGNTTVKLHEAFEATNNVVFSIVDTRSTPYVSQVSLQRQDGGSISSLTPTIETEKINTGLGFHVIASVANGNISLRLSLSQSDLVRFDPYRFGTGDSSISGALPVTDNQHRVIPMVLRDGETRLIANLSQSRFRNEEAGIGLGFFNGAEDVSANQKQTVIAVTAKIL